MVVYYFMFAESTNELVNCHSTLGKDDHVENMMTISSQTQTVNSTHPLQYLESVEIEFNNPIYQESVAGDEVSIPDHEYDNPIYGIAMPCKSEEESYNTKS